jgi:hypothetical protein
MTFDYAARDFSVRQDIGEAHRVAWAALARTGTWWTGEERVAIAQEVRNATFCPLCAERKAAMQPASVKGEHLSSTSLSLAAIDAAHRIVTDQGRITRSWFESVTSPEDGITVEQYVELAGVVVLVFSIDEFNRGLGFKPEPLPDPELGEPSRYRPAMIDYETGFVPMVAPNGAVGNEADLWQNGRTANVLRALTLVPNAFREWVPVADAQYLSFRDMGNYETPPDRSLHRMQIELVAGRVSAVNECFY